MRLQDCGMGDNEAWEIKGLRDCEIIIKKC